MLVIPDQLDTPDRSVELRHLDAEDLHFYTTG